MIKEGAVSIDLHAMAVKFLEPWKFPDIKKRLQLDFADIVEHDKEVARAVLDEVLKMKDEWYDIDGSDVEDFKHKLCGE
jgi:hypothetical protein